MSGQFNVVVAGRVRSGFASEQVAQQLQQQLKLPAAKARQLLAGKTVVVKRNVDRQVASSYCQRLQALGVEAAVAAVAAPAPAQAATESAAALPTPNSAAYRRTLIKTAAATTALVAAYCFVTLLTLLVFVYYALHFASLLWTPPVLFSALLYLLPLLGLGLAAVLLARPLLPRGQNAAPPLPLYPTGQPALFRFINDLCTGLGIEAPAVVSVDCGTAAAATARPGWQSPAAQEYQLCFGLPLLQLSQRDFAGVLARALGPGTRPLALHSRQVIDSAATRVEDCLRGRDWLGRRLQAMQQRAQPRAAAPVLRAAAICLAAAAPMLRRCAAALAALRAQLDTAAEQEADRYQVLVAGSAAFADIQVALEQLTLAAERAAPGRCDGETAGTVDNLPALIRHYREHSEEKLPGEWRRQWEQRPRNALRAERAEAWHQAGIGTAPQPAALLVQNIDTAEREATRRHYRQLGLPCDEAALIPVEEALYAASLEMTQRQQAEQYFNGWESPLRFWQLPDWPLISAMAQNEAVRQLNVCVNEIRRLTPDRQRLLAEYDKLQNQIREILVGQQVLAARHTFQFRYLKYDGTSLQPLLENLQAELVKVATPLSTQETIMGGRIALGLRLSGENPALVADLHAAMSRMRAFDNRLYKLQLDTYLLGQLQQRRQALRESGYDDAITRLEQKLREHGNALLERLADIPWPLAENPQSLRDYLAAQLPAAGETPAPVLERTRALLDRFQAAYARLARQAVEYAANSEAAYRVKRIKLIAGE